MLCYVVICGFDYEGYDIKGIFLSRDSADVLVEEIRKSEDYDYVEIQEYEAKP
jgi:hypothetical protein